MSQKNHALLLPKYVSTRRACDVRDVSIWIRFFLYFATLNEKRKNTNIEREHLKRQFFLVRSRDRNHFSFSLVEEKLFSNWSVVRIVSFRKCDSPKRVLCCYWNNVLTTKRLFDSETYYKYILLFHYVCASFLEISFINIKTVDMQTKRYYNNIF